MSSSYLGSKIFLTLPLWIKIHHHSALKWLLNSLSETENKRLKRWKILLLEHTYNVVYQKGTKHSNTDALSWINETTGQKLTPNQQQ